MGNTSEPKIRKEILNKKKNIKVIENTLVLFSLITRTFAAQLAVKVKLLVGIN